MSSTSSTPTSKSKKGTPSSSLATSASASKSKPLLKKERQPDDDSAAPLKQQPLRRGVAKTKSSDSFFPSVTSSKTSTTKTSSIRDPPETRGVRKTQSMSTVISPKRTKSSAGSLSSLREHEDLNDLRKPKSRNGGGGSVSSKQSTKSKGTKPPTTPTSSPPKRSTSSSSNGSSATNKAPSSSSSITSKPTSSSSLNKKSSSPSATKKPTINKKASSSSTTKKPASTNKVLSSSSAHAKTSDKLPSSSFHAKKPASTNKLSISTSNHAKKPPPDEAIKEKAKLSLASATAAAESYSNSSARSNSITSDEDLSMAKQRDEKDAVRAKYQNANSNGSCNNAASELRPGAYSIQGQSIQQRFTSLSPAEAAVVRLEHDLMSVTSSKRNVAKGYLGKPIPSSISSLAPVQEGNEKAQRKPSATNLVVAAELSSDAEAYIAEQVRQQLLQSATRADVVTVEPAKDNVEEQRRVAQFKDMHRPKGAKERIFGDSRKTNEAIDIAATPECIRKRDLLKWTLKRNKAANQWVASVITNQKALENSDTVEMERSTCNYTADTQREAFEIGLAMAVPRMHNFDDNPICFICKAKFALLRRPSHCRNCGICMCSNCTVTWPCKMIPDTYNTKNEFQTKVCLACDWLSSSFREALLGGRYQMAVDLHATGNVNLRAPFCKERQRGTEVCYPIHLAVIGGSLKVLEWLCTMHFCPLIVQGKGRKSGGPLVTSKGRSALGLALKEQQLEIVRYLMVDQGMALTAEKDLSSQVMQANLTTMMQMLPQDFFVGKQITKCTIGSASHGLSSSSIKSSHMSSNGSVGTSSTSSL